MYVPIIRVEINTLLFMLQQARADDEKTAWQPTSQAY
jgi:hypothetical protein